MMCLRESPIETFCKTGSKICDMNTAPNTHECICQELMEQLLGEWVTELIEENKKCR